VDRLTKWVLAFLGALAFIGANALIVYAVLRRSISPTRGAYLVVLIVLLALSATLLMDGLIRGGRLAFESNWGGLGGGLGGWQVSSVFTYLLLSIGLFVMLVAAIGVDTPHPDLLERYGAALNFAAQNGIKFEKSEVVSGKLVLKGTAPSQQVLNEFWDEVKLANPFHDDIAPDLTIKAPAGSSGTTGVK
jgi:hypothetical protein